MALARVLRGAQGRTRGGDICRFNEGLRGCVRVRMGEGIVAIQGSEALYASKNSISDTVELVVRHNRTHSGICMAAIGIFPFYYLFQHRCKSSLRQHNHQRLYRPYRPLKLL